ncbi:hypothetical protein [Pyxidicoccus xibeiensis]|uniref:hypothetical protein n=1 Tax=Pyxidicoccus xibeiensis TaxID=2906759 RepID=UPI0020A80E88|nr:hypothetical protein [Pyxidicoccus xibeiensis]MCP3140351.1 hypothetical protein [Pyxidicoccus xibeiensis]
MTLLAHLSLWAYTLHGLVWPVMVGWLIATVSRRTMSAALNFAACVLCVVGLRQGFAYRHRVVELEATPVIAALEDFQQTRGRYPEQLSELPPSVWAQLPAANPAYGRWQGAGDVSCYYRAPDTRRKDYGITCVTLMFLKHSYDRERRRWYTWD